MYELEAEDGATATAMTGFGGVNMQPADLATARREIRSNLGASPTETIGTATAAERSSSTLFGSIPSSTTSTQSSGTVTATLVLVAGYGYDPFNRRLVRMTAAGSLDVRYAYDGWREVEELEPVAEGETTTAVARKVLVWGARFTELLSYHRWNSGSSSSDSYMVTQDEQGSVTRLHDASGNEVERVEYLPYGGRTVYVPTGGGSYTSQSASSVGLEVGYTGHRHDPETDLVYARNRYLHTDWGRFVTVDPLGAWVDGGSLANGYAFAGNTPSINLDFLGFTSISSGYGGVGGAIRHDSPPPSDGASGGTCGTAGGQNAGGPSNDLDDPGGNNGGAGSGSIPDSATLQCCIPSGGGYGPIIVGRFLVGWNRKEGVVRYKTPLELAAIWIASGSDAEVPAHQSLAVGHPLGQYDEFSYGVESRLDAFLGKGRVYHDTMQGGAPVAGTYHLISKDNADRIRKALIHFTGSEGGYSLPGGINCRHWSQKQLEITIGLLKRKGRFVAPAVPPVDSSSDWLTPAIIGGGIISVSQGATTATGAAGAAGLAIASTAATIAVGHAATTMNTSR